MRKEHHVSKYLTKEALQSTVEKAVINSQYKSIKHPKTSF